MTDKSKGGGPDNESVTSGGTTPPPALPAAGEGAPETTAPIVAKLAEEVDVPPTAIQKMFEMGVAAFSGPIQRYHPIFDKFTEAHVDKFLDYIQRDDDHDFELRKRNPWFILLFSLVGIGFLVFLVVWMLPDHKDLLEDIIKLAIAVGGAFGGGYGWKAYLDSKKRRP